MAERISRIVMIVLLLTGALAFFVGLIGESYEFMIMLAYIYSGVTIVGALAGAVTGAMAKPDSIKGSAIGIVAMLVVIGISYGMASGEVLSNYPEGTTETAVRWSGAGLYMLYILTGLSILAIVYSGVARVINK